MTYSIRSASHLDEAFIYEMLYQALYVPPEDEPLPRSILSQPDIAHYASGFGTHNGDAGFIAETGDDRIGAAWVRLLTGDDRGFGYVDDDTPELSVAVTSEWRGRGVGTALIAAVVKDLPRVSLSTDSRNPASQLYARLGFKCIATDRTSLTMLRQT